MDHRKTLKPNKTVKSPTPEVPLIGYFERWESQIEAIDYTAMLAIMPLCFQM